MTGDLVYYPQTASLHRDDFASKKEYREAYQDYDKHYGFKVRVEGGWKFFEFATDYDAWKRQK